MAKQEIYDYLREIGCCPLCCLRFFNGRADDYQNVQKSLESVSIHQHIQSNAPSITIASPIELRHSAKSRPTPRRRT